MSTLVLARHGQARAFSEDPDQLSGLGWEQARALGRYWIERGTRFDAAYYGTLRRQRETFEAVASEFELAGRPFPAATVLPGLNEYGAQDLIAEIAPKLAEADDEFSPLWREWQAHRDAPDRNRWFQRMFEALVARWVAGSFDDPSLEPWEAFAARVQAALHRIRADQGSGKRVVAFSSGGPIGVAVQTCLGAPPSAALSLNWRVRNTSLTRFLYSRVRLSLDGFNELPHMARATELETFR